MSTNMTAAETSAVAAFYKISIGKKILMAVSGFVWIGFVFGHMIGNLQVFLGQDQLNAYAHALQSLGAGLWIVRLVVFSALAIHIWSGVMVWAENKTARPVKYVKQAYQKSTISSRTMIFSGIGLALFIVYHLLHYTARITNPEYSSLPLDSAGRFDVFTMMINGFSSKCIVGTYVLAMAALAFHINHALQSMFQTLGLAGEKHMPCLKRLSFIAALVLFFGYVSIPLAILAGCKMIVGGGI